MKKTFDEAWAEKERQGYQYGDDAIEQVRLGWELCEAAMARSKPGKAERFRYTGVMDAPIVVITRYRGPVGHPDVACVDNPQRVFLSVDPAHLEPAEDSRPSWPETWMSIATTIAQRSYDERLKVGAVIVSEDNTVMLACGYNGNARGLPNRPESTEPGQSGFLHAELNAVIKCDFNFPKRKIMYCTHSTCRACAKVVANAGISRFVYRDLYRDASGLEVLRDCGIEALSLDEAILIG